MSAKLARPFICSTCRSIHDVSVKGRTIRNAAVQAYSTASSIRRPLRLAIIGSGPAGYYSAYRMMKKLPDAFVDMYESLPVPYGLVRFGVAPDHPEVKNSSENLDDVAKWSNFTFAGNVPIGEDPASIPLRTIAAHYDAILFAYGASRDKTLGIPGEDLEGVLSARAFVGWYNGLPEYANLNPRLSLADTAVILGQGNVALDVARILLAPIDELRKTDISEEALETLSNSRLREVKVIGRRGPLQAPYSIKELRELMHVQSAAFVPPEEGWDRHIGVPRKALPRQLRRIVEVLEKGSSATRDQIAKIWQLRYLQSPVEFLSTGDGSSSSHGRSLGAIAFESMQYAGDVESVIAEAKDLSEMHQMQAVLNGIRRIRVKQTGVKEVLPASLAFRSIGYLSEALGGFKELGIPFDEKLGIIPNDMHGRVISPDKGPGSLTAGHVPGMYCAGWVKRGPTGVIASTMDDAFHTADIVIRDWQDEAKFNELASESKQVGWEGVRQEVERRGIRSVSWQDWEKIDAEERRRGQAKGKVREKFRSTGEMLQVLDS